MSLKDFLKSKVFLKQIVYAIIVLALLFFALVQWLSILTKHNEKIQVPNLSKMNLENAVQKLHDLNLDWEVSDSAIYNPNYPKQSIVDQSPVAGDFVKENRKIFLTLNPSGYANIDIPDFYGKTKRQAIAQLTALGFRIDPTQIYIPDIARDVVRGLLLGDKDLKMGDKVQKNAVLTLKLGDGGDGINPVIAIDSIPTQPEQ